MAAVEAPVSGVRHALAEALGVRPTVANTDTVDVAGAARLLYTSPQAIRVRRSRGQMPRPISKRPLVWRVKDILAMGG